MKKESDKTIPNQARNTNTPSWQGIPFVLKSIILDFLSPMEALPTISTSKDNINKFGKHIIKRLCDEQFAYTTLTVGAEHTLAMRKDGYLFAWGENMYGQLGLGHNKNQHTPQLINSNFFQAKIIQSIHTGWYHNLTLCTDSTLIAWGMNEYGQLGLGHNKKQRTPQNTEYKHFNGKRIQSIHTLYYHNLALCNNGELFAWGKNYYGQLGLGHTNKQYSPQPFPDPLERTFRTGHHKLHSTSFFSNTAVDPKSRFLSGSVLHPIETDQSRTQSTTTAMGNQQPQIIDK